MSIILILKVQKPKRLDNMVDSESAEAQGTCESTGQAMLILYMKRIIHRLIKELLSEFVELLKLPDPSGYT